MHAKYPKLNVILWAVVVTAVLACFPGGTIVHAQDGPLANPAVNVTLASALPAIQAQALPVVGQEPINPASLFRWDNAQVGAAYSFSEKTWVTALRLPFQIVEWRWGSINGSGSIDFNAVTPNIGDMDSYRLGGGVGLTARNVIGSVSIGLVYTPKYRLSAIVGIGL
jgi:hypothetical protein